MSVSIGNQGSQIYVELAHNGKAVQIPCKDQKEAEQVAKAATEAEAKITEKEQEIAKAQGAAPTNGVTTPPEMQPQVPPVNLSEGKPPKGVGEKLDIKSA